MQSLTQNLSELIEQRYLASELLACVVRDIFPNTVLLGGGLHSLGFYYDFKFERPLTDEMVELIEVHFLRYVKEDHPIRFISMMRENAQALLKHHHFEFLSLMAGRQPSNILELIQINQFFGLCPTLSLTSSLDAGYVKLLDWAPLIKIVEDEEIVATRLIGTTQKTSKEAKDLKKKFDSYSKKNDHSHIGMELNLFQFRDTLKGKEIHWLPKGVKLQTIIYEWIKNKLSYDADPIITPMIIDNEYFSKNSLLCICEEQEFPLRSSFSSGHLETANELYQKGEGLPLRLAELSYLFESFSDVDKVGLFCQNSHLSEQTTICCIKEQVVEELISSLHLFEQIITMFDLKAHWYLITSRRREKKGDREQEAIVWLRKAFESNCHDWQLDSVEESENVCLEGPILELRVEDGMGREWPTSRLGVILSDELRSIISQTSERLVILKRQIWQSLDCFIALLLERYEGSLPLWVTPEQVRILVIGEANLSYGKKIYERFKREGWRAKLDQRQAKLNTRIRDAEIEKVPFVILIGEQERMKQTINVRSNKKNHLVSSINLETFLDENKESIFRPYHVKTRRGEGKELES